METYAGLHPAVFIGVAEYTCSKPYEGLWTNMVWWLPLMNG